MIGRRQSRVAPEIPTSSMADIAFLLIVFFLVTTTMNQDKGLSLHLPPVGETKEVQEKNILNVWINARDQIAFFENEQLTPVPFAELKARIAGRLQENENLIVSLKTERGATYRTFVDVLDELKLAGATKISIANPEE
ncbi:MAG: biopolymer transporter ExbD [Gemmatimonadetes bacterium]|nr:biopolymer transporter ExbD [Gemmatimonadota bacterium]